MNHHCDHHKNLCNDYHPDANVYHFRDDDHDSVHQRNHYDHYNNYQSYHINDHQHNHHNHHDCIRTGPGYGGQESEALYQELEPQYQSLDQVIVISIITVIIIIIIINMSNITPPFSISR